MERTEMTTLKDVTLQKRSAKDPINVLVIEMRTTGSMEEEH